jgi:predicted ester cyclase
MRVKSMFAAGLLLGFPAGAAAEARAMTDPAGVVRSFLDEVRTGRDPDAAAQYFAPRVSAHQVTSEGETTVLRTPADYAAHIREFLALFGRYRFSVEEIIAQGDRVYVRWRQQGHHQASLRGEAPTGAPLTEISSAVYRVNDGRIVEYWIQTDRKGLEIQLEKAASQSRR